MKINLDKLRKAGWHIGWERDKSGLAKSPAEADVIELIPPPMSAGEHQKLRDVIASKVSTPIAIDMVMGQLYDSLTKAALIEILED